MSNINNLLIENESNTYEGDNNSELNECRICYEEVLNPKKYCLCSGTQAYIHPECLIKSMNDNNTTYVSNKFLKKKCELCQYDIKLEREKTWQSYFIYAGFYIMFFLAFIIFTYLDSVNNFVENLYAGIIVLVSLLCVLYIMCLITKYLIEKLNIYEFKITILEYIENGDNP